MIITLAITQNCPPKKNKKQNKKQKTKTKRGVCYTLWPCHLQYIKKVYFKAKEELWKFKYFTMQKYNLQKIFFLKRN